MAAEKVENRGGDQGSDPSKTVAGDRGKSSTVSQAGPSSGSPGGSPREPVRRLPEPGRIPLSAYLACALTGLTDEQRQLIFHLSDTVSVVCSEVGIEVYEPRKKTDPVHHADVSDTEVFQTDRERVLRSDLLIHLCHYPSTGSGQELDFAYTALLPIVLIRHADKRASRMITGIPSVKVEISYREPEDLRLELQIRLAQIRPLLEERKLAYTGYDKNIVGAKVRALREGLGMSRDELARITRWTSDGIRQVEESPDRISNVSLIQLRQLASALKTTAAELVAPNLGELVVAELDEWLEGRQAARSPDVSQRDRRRLLRRVLLQVVDSLESSDG